MTSVNSPMQELEKTFTSIFGMTKLTNVVPGISLINLSTKKNVKSRKKKLFRRGHQVLTVKKMEIFPLSVAQPIFQDVRICIQLFYFFVFL